jgi:predicted peroxiredoxin
VRTALLVSTDLPWAAGLALQWRAAGDGVTLVLLDGAVAAARRGHEAENELQRVIEAGVVVWAHTDALRRRAISGDRRVEGVKVVDLDELADMITDDADKVVWL